MSAPATAELALQPAPHALGRAGDRLRRRLGEATFDAWFSKAWIENHSGAVVRIAVPSRFVADWLRNRYEAPIVDALRAEVRTVERVEIVVRPPRHPEG